jgi:hypothetical protein
MSFADAEQRWQTLQWQPVQAEHSPAVHLSAWEILYS